MLQIENLVSPCDVRVLFPDAEELLRHDPYGYVEEPTGPPEHRHTLYLKTAYWAIKDDPLKVQGCVMALVEFLDGSPVAVRYKKADVHPFGDGIETAHFLAPRRAGRGAKTLFYPIARRCACKGTGKISPADTFKKGERVLQAFCPVHKCQRY